MIRRVTIPWPADQATIRRGRPRRLLAVSDEVEASLERADNRSAIAPLDLIVGCGDLSPSYLAMLGDSFGVPLVYVRGNHDRGAGWDAEVPQLPEPLPDARVEVIDGLPLVGLSWPGGFSGRAGRDERDAWRQVVRLGLARRGPCPRLVISHVPPAGAGDDPTDAYHRGFRAYGWLTQRLKPLLWLHGHTTVATRRSHVVMQGATTFVNVTGATLIELAPMAIDGLPEEGDTAAAPEGSP